MEIKTRGIFRPQAQVSFDSLLSDTSLDQRLFQVTSLKVLALVIAIPFVGVLFVNISLGVSAQGIVAYSSKNSAVLAEKNGIVTWVASVRELVSVIDGDRVAHIKDIDRNLKSAIVDERFVLASLGERRKIIARSIKSTEDEIGKDREAVKAQEDGIKSQISAQLELNEILNQTILDTNEKADKYYALKNQGLVTEASLEQYNVRKSDLNISLKQSEAQIEALANEVLRAKAEFRARSTVAYQNLLSFQNEDEQLKLEAEAEEVKLNGAHQVTASGTLIPRGYRVGQIVSAGDVLFYISSDDQPDFQFEIDVSARDIGDIEIGQATKISFEAFPYFEYGFVDGLVTHVTQVPNQDVSLNGDLPSQLMYRVIVTPDKKSLSSYINDKYVFEGMGVEVHVKKEKTAVWRLLLAPLLRLGSRL